MATKAKNAPKKVPLEDKEYRLLKYSPLSFTLKTGRDNNLIVFDEEKGENRAIKHCPNEKSIYVDEQSKNAIVQEVIFLNGLMEVKGRQIVTQAFLENHPSRGIIFDKIDESADAEEMIDVEEIILDIKNAIRTKAREDNGIEELRVVVSVLISNMARASKMSSAQLKKECYDLIDENYNRFVDEDGDVTIFDDPTIVRKAISLGAFNSGVVKITPDGKKIMWSDNKAVICMVPLSRNHKDYFADFLETEEGMIVVQELKRRS